MTGDINSSWQPDTTVSSEVEVKFIAEGANATRVELEHRKFEQMGAEPGESMRKDVDGGWRGLLEIFKQQAEAACGTSRGIMPHSECRSPRLAGIHERALQHSPET